MSPKPPLKAQLQQSVAQALSALGVNEIPEIIIQETPSDKEGDYGTPVAFSLARVLRKAPAQIAGDIAQKLQPPPFVRRAFAVGGYLNFELEPGYVVRSALEAVRPFPKQPGKVLVEHTAVNPNKELHVGHLRNVCLGDSVARILDFAGHEVEVLNYIDDTGRQAADSLFALRYFGLKYDGSQKYDHWVGEAYVRLHRELADEAKKALLEPQIAEVLHQLEEGKLREEVDKILRSQLQTMHRLGARYDVLVWESDIVHEGLLKKALEILEKSPYVFRPSEGKYAGALVIDASQIIPGLEDPYFVLVRSNGASTYYAKDIAFQMWKMGLLQGLKFDPYPGDYPAFHPGRPMYTSTPSGSVLEHVGATQTINVIDARQSHPQMIVRAGLEVAGRHDLAEGAYHLAYETVLLEGQQMSGRKGITVSVDEVLDEAVKRARAVIAEKNPDHPEPEAAAEAIGVGAVRFAMVKTEAKKQIDFRYDQALAFEGDTGPYLQYAHARASSILRKAEEQGLANEAPDFGQVTPYELELAKALLRFGETVGEAAKHKAPNLLAQYLLELGAVWNAYYNAKTPDGKSATPVLSAPQGLRGVRLELVRSLKRTLAQGLGLLGLQAPEVM
ncbi:arginine--tRNA ligase [Calidithermus timidus]|jgi:arginyl-tRNA synthetase|uniref:arginine--tRNA ligase n=1 Tax=Calidithermus timidus TaxID=307124 RepID=UPI0003731134|nr:arginine--tRNA ligase [Calidithermus timidus]